MSDFDQEKETWTDFGPKQQCSGGKRRKDVRKSAVLA